MADNTTPQNVEVLKLQLLVTQLQAQLIATQAEVARYQHRELMQESSRLQQAIRDAQQSAGMPVDVPAVKASAAG